MQDFLPYKLKTLAFRNFRYCQVKEAGSSSIKRYIMLSDSTGFMVEINVTGLLNKNFK